MKTVNKICIIILIITIHCGKGIVDFNETAYEPKIVIEGYLTPHQKVENIRISRNFPLNKEINILDFPIKDAAVRLTNMQNNLTIELTYNPGFIAYEYRGGDFEISSGNSYRLDVNAKIEGHPLAASSITTVPQAGFSINEELSQLAPLKYRERDENGDIKAFKIAFTPSPGTDFYALSIVALDASEATFVQDNPFDVDVKDLDDEFLNRLKYEGKWLQTFSLKQESVIDILWVDTWFYGRYRAILYAGDPNFKYYFTTHKNVQDIDGNLYEPRFNIQGNGIGVFGSCIPDTVFFQVLR